MPSEIELDPKALGAARQANRSEFHNDEHTSWAEASDAAVVTAIRAYLAAAPSPDVEGQNGWWHYKINYGPDGEENYANVYNEAGELVGNLKIHHARAIVGGLNDAALRPVPTDEAVEALKPFAAIADQYDDAEDDDFQVWKDFDVLGAGLPLKHFRAARAALSAAPSGAVDWQPIETAPHNRSVLLGWKDWRDGNWCMEVGPASWGTRVGSTSNMSGHGSATHWMPLPSAPSALQTGGET